MPLSPQPPSQTLLQWMRSVLNDTVQPYLFEDTVLSEVAALYTTNGVVDSDRMFADLWSRKATSYSELVNVSENGSSRSLSDLYKNASAIAARYKAAVDAADAAAAVVLDRPRMNSIERV